MQQGKDTVLAVQDVTAALGEGGHIIKGLTENSYSIENDMIDESTKFGRIVGYGQNSETFEVTAYGEKGDLGQKALMDAIKNKRQIKLWEIDISANETGDHDAMFAFCIVESIEKSYPQDGFMEISATLQVIGGTAEGKYPALSPEEVEFATYGFEVPGESTGEFPEQKTTAV